MDYGTAVDELGRAARDFFAARGEAFETAVAAVVSALKAGGKVLVFGNGGSAAESQHFAAELVNKFTGWRKALPAIALSTDTSALTAIANDLSFDAVFRRQVEALGRPGDVAVGLSTSGRSKNVVEALRAAKAMGLTTIAMTGPDAGAMAGAADFTLDVPSPSTPRIQEMHLLLLHLMAEEVDREFL